MMMPACRVMVLVSKSSSKELMFYYSISLEFSFVGSGNSVIKLSVCSVPNPQCLFH